MNQPGQPLITAAMIHDAKKRVEEVGRLQAQKQMRVREPHLYDALCEFSNHALADRPETLSDETQTAIYDALWRGAVVAVEAYRIAHFQMWAGTLLGTRLAQLDADLARRASEAAAPQSDGESTDETV